MSAIEVTQLQKTFQTKRKAAGLRGSVRALFKPEYSSIEAVRKLSFQMEAGELLGFIGPNGAGKSTTIKMLTGILHPSAGDAKVLGFIPWKERQKLAYHIGTVFGNVRSCGITSLPLIRSCCSGKFTRWMIVRQKTNRVSRGSL